MAPEWRVPAVVAAALLVGAGAAGCGSSGATTAASPTSGAAASAVLGTPKAATGAPFTLGLLNLETGPVAFPEYRQAAEAAARYLNAYRGGVAGRPIRIVSCATDGQPSTSARCAAQIVDRKPALILGGADTGAPGALPVYARAKLAYVGGIPFTPVESNAANAVEFISVAGADLAASVAHVSAHGAKKLVVIYTDDSQGKAGGLGVITPVAKRLGMSVKAIPVSPSSPDLASTAAAAMADAPDAIFLDSPNSCSGLARALKAVGSTAQLIGIDVCVSPPALKAAGDAVEGLTFSQPFPSPGSGDKDTGLFLAAVKRYGAKDLVIDSISQAAFASVMNIQAALDPLGAAKATDTTAILEAFKTGRDHPNFMAHPYTCDGTAIPSARSICNAHQIVKQLKGGHVVAPDGQTYVSAGRYLP